MAVLTLFSNQQPSVFFPVLFHVESDDIERWEEPAGAACLISCPDVIWYDDTDDRDAEQMFICVK